MSTHRTVLVVTDSNESDNDYEHQLQQDRSFTYRILTERYDIQILALSQSQQVDGILLELDSPPSSSFDVLRQLKQQMGEQCPPIVVIDSNDAEMAVQAFKNGAVDYLVKDRMTPDDLRLAMRSAIENAELRRELQRSQQQFQTSVENMLDCFGIFSCIRNELGQIVDFRIDYLNGAACENNRMPKQMQIGRRLCELLPAHRKSGLFDEYCRVVETGEPLIKDSLIYDDVYDEQRLIRAFDIRATKLNDGFVASWRDITDRKRLELELSQTVTDLQQQQHRLQRLIDTAPIGIGIGSANGEVRVINDAMLRLHGLTREEFEQQGMNWRVFAPPELAQKTEQAMVQLRQQGVLPPEEKELLRRDGSRIPIWISLTQWMDGTDEHVAFAVDLTQQKQAEAAIQQLNRDLTNRVSELQALLDMIPVGIAIATDPTCTQMQNNAYIRQLLGTSPDANISKSAPADEQPLYRVFQNGQEVPEENLPMQVAARLGVDVRDTEFEIVLPDGRIRQILAYTTPLRDEDNQIRGALGAFLDITELSLAQAALQSSQQRYRQLAEAMPQIVWTADATGTVNYWNQRWYEYTGLSEAESMGLAGINTVHPDDRDRTLTQWSQSVANREPFEIAYRIRRWDGVYHWFISRGIPLANNQGQITGWIGTITDIDAQKQLEARLLNEIANHQRTEQELRATNQKVISILESMTDAYVAVDRDWRITYVNQMAARINQVSPEELIGRFHWQVWADIQGTIAEEYYEQAIANQTPVHFEYFYESRQRWYQVHAYPSPDGLGIYFRDITDAYQQATQRQQAELALQEAHIQLEAALTAGSIYTWRWNIPDNLVMTDRNFAHLFGIDPEEAAAGLPIEQFLNAMHPDDRPQVTAKIERAIATGEDYAAEFRVRNADTQERWVIARGRVEYDANGNAIAFPGALADITDRKQADAQLRESEQRFRTLADNISQFAWMADENGKIFWYNQRWFEYTGTTLEEMQGSGWQQVHHPDHVERVVKKFRHCIATGETWEDTFPLRGKDGQYRWFLSRAVPVRNQQGKVLRWFGTNTDITELRETEIALKQTTQRLNVALKSAPIALFNQDLELRYTWIYNPAQGFSVEEVIGRQDADLLSPEAAARLTQLKQQVLDTGVGLREEVKVIKEGQTSYFDLTIDPIRDSQNVIVGITGAAVDISERARLEAERQQTEQALRQSEDRLRMAIESAQLGTWDLNLSTHQLTWDAGCKAMFGLPPEAETSLEVFFKGLHPDDALRVEQVMQESLNPTRSGNYDIEYRTIGIQDGIERWIRAKGQAYFDGRGKPLRFIGTVLDITEQKQAEAEREQLLRQEQAAREAAERANRIKDEFLAVLSHELRSPLNPILGWTKLLQTRKFDETKMAQALATIERNAKLQTQLIDDLLDVAKILRGKLSLNITAVTLSFVIEAAIDTVRTSALDKSISLQSVLPNIGQVSGDAARLQQIVWNLLSNAIKFTPNGGQVDIRLERVGNQAQITVSDTGKGISTDFLPHIFESFRQEDASITRKYGGLGLGLAIVRELVEAQGGTITADSPGEGLGATFTVRLPLLNVEPEIKQTDEMPQKELDLTGIRVLTVDDEPDARELLTVLLSQYGAEVLSVACAAQVLANLESFQPDVLVSDIGMPEVDGYTLIQQIRALPPEKGGQIPAIALTAYARDDDHQRAITSGYQRHVTKPLEPEQLVQAVMVLAQR